MPDFSDLSRLQVSQVITLLPLADRVDGVENVIFNPKGATKFYLTRDVNQKNPTSTITDSVQSGSITGVANITDLDVDTNGNWWGGSGTAVGISRHDFGSLATRDILVICQSGNSKSTLLQIRHNTDGDTASPAAWSSWVTVISGVGIPKQTVDTGSFNARHWELKFSGNELGGDFMYAYELYNGDEGWGDSNGRFEMQEPGSSVWITIPELTVPTQESASGNSERYETYINTLPGSAKVRYVSVNNGTWNGSVSIILVDPRLS